MELLVENGTNVKPVDRRATLRVRGLEAAEETLLCPLLDVLGCYAEDVLPTTIRAKPEALIVKTKPETPEQVIGPPADQTRISTHTCTSDSPKNPSYIWVSVGNRT